MVKKNPISISTLKGLTIFPNIVKYLLPFYNHLEIEIEN